MKELHTPPYRDIQLYQRLRAFLCLWDPGGRMKSLLSDATPRGGALPGPCWRKLRRGVLGAGPHARGNPSSVSGWKGPVAPTTRGWGMKSRNFLCPPWCHSWLSWDLQPAVGPPGWQRRRGRFRRLWPTCGGLSPQLSRGGGSAIENPEQPCCRGAPEQGAGGIGTSGEEGELSLTPVFSFHLLLRERLHRIQTKCKHFVLN